MNACGSSSLGLAEPPTNSPCNNFGLTYEPATVLGRRHVTLLQPRPQFAAMPAATSVRSGEGVNRVRTPAGCGIHGCMFEMQMHD
jgi:hypothetical protein